MKIAIIGCGFAGLSSALLSAQKGHNIVIYEKFESPQAVGAGILLQPSTWHILKQLNIFDEVIKQSERVSFLDGENPYGKHVLSSYYSDASEKGLFGMGILRHTLFNLLYHKVKNHPNVEIITSAQVTSLYEIKSYYDLVIIANGAKSELKNELPIKQSTQLYPWGCLWSVVEEQYAYVGHLKQYLNGSTTMLGFLPSGFRDSKRVLSVFWSIPVDYKDTWEQYKENIVEHIEYYTYSKSLINNIKNTDFSFACYYDTWMDKYYHENIVVIGDAAHSMSPQLGQGANMALIDSYELSCALNNNEQLSDALRQYQIVRKEHINFYTQMSRFLTPFFQSSNNLYGTIRDIMFSTSRKIPLTRRISADILVGKKTSFFK